MKYFFIFIGFFVLLTSCLKSSGKDVVIFEIPPSFRIYLVDGKVESIDVGKKVALDDLELEKEPLVAEDDIVAYDWETHTIQLKASSFKRFTNHVVNGPDAKLTAPDSEDLWRAGAAGKVFVVVVNGKRAYFGEFTSPIGSLERSFPVVDLSFELPDIVLAENSICIELRLKVAAEKDPRKQEWIKNTLKSMDKLK